MATVLLVDDILDFRVLARHVCHQLNLQVREAGTGSEALDILRADDSICLVLLDIGLPDVSGLALMQRLRSEWPNLRIAIVTGSRDKNDVLKALKLETDDYIIKPIDPALLREKISRILHMNTTESEFVTVDCDFAATLESVPVAVSFHIRALSEAGCKCESLNRFLVGSSFSFRCPKLGDVVGEAEYVFRARVDRSEPISQVSDRFSTEATFLGIPENTLVKIRKFTMSRAPLK